MVVHLAWLASEEQLREFDARGKFFNAMGTLRVFRALLAFGIFLKKLSGAEQIVCVLADVDEEDLEIYSTIEPCMHCL